MSLLLFAGDTYYPEGGADDLVAICDDWEEVNAQLRSHATNDRGTSWANVVDSTTGHKWDGSVTRVRGGDEPRWDGPR